MHAALTAMAVLLLAVTAHAADLTARPNLSGGSDVRTLDGAVILSGQPNVSGGQTFRSLDGAIIVETRPSLSGETIDLGDEDATDD